MAKIAKAITTGTIKRILAASGTYVPNSDVNSLMLKFRSFLHQLLLLEFHYLLDEGII